jgi:hypothetical protein
VKIAIDAGKGKIVEFISSTMNLRNYMLDVKRGQW